MTGTRKRYSADFKAKVALEALRGELTAGTAGEQAQHPPDDGRRVEEAGDGRAGGGVFRPVGGAGNGKVIGGCCTRRYVSCWWNGIFWRKPSVDEYRGGGRWLNPTSSAIGCAPV
jgi:hypothetical protein